jgi:PAS domain S-box-containing protein
MFASSSFTIGWQQGAASLLLCLFYLLLYPLFTERAFRFWIGGWWLYALAAFASVEGPAAFRGAALILGMTGSVLLLASSIEWIGWGSRLHYLWPLALTLGGGLSLGLAWAPGSGFLWWAVHFFEAGLLIAAGWLLLRTVRQTRLQSVAFLGAALLLRGLHMLDRGSWAGNAESSSRMLFDLLFSMGAGVAMAVVVLSETRRRSQELRRGLKRLTSISADAAVAPGVEKMLEHALGQLIEEMRVSAGWIGLVEQDERGGHLRLRAVSGFSEAFRREPPSLELSEAWVQQGLRSEVSVFTAADHSHPTVRHLLRSEHLGTLLCVPLPSLGLATAAESLPLGLLAVAASNLRRFSEEEKRFLTNVAHLLSVHSQRLRLAERAARTERVWGATLDEIDDPVLLHDDKFCVLQVNRTAARRLGLEPAMLLGRPLRDVLRPGTARWNHCPYCEEAAGRPGERDPNFGGYLVATGAAMEGPDGRPATLHLLRDVTARRRAEEKLRNLFDNMQEGAFISTPGGRFLDFNEAFRRMLGYETREELLCADIGKELFVNPADRERLMKLLHDHGSVSGFEFSMRCRDGEVINFMESSVAIRDASGAMVAVEGFVLDITERKQAEIEVRRRNRELLLLNAIGLTLGQPLELDELLARALRQVTDLFDLDVAAVLLVDKASGCVDRRSAVGFRSNALNWVSQRIVPEGLWQQVQRTHATVLASQALASVPVFRKLSEEEGLKAWWMILLWWKERIVGGFLVGSRSRSELSSAELNLLVAVASQIAARVETTALYEETKQALENLRRAQEQLVQSEKMVAIGQLISGVAHELNNPLTAILGYSELLGATPDASSQTADYAAKIAKQAQRTQKIVQNLLSFARQQKPERGSVRINEVLEDTIGLRDYDWRRNKIAVVREYDADLPETQGDRHQLQQVFLNILNNAFDVLISSTEPRGISVRTAWAEGRVLIEFTDSGPGVREPMRVFDPFYTTKAVGEGTGLGLSICYGILKEHGGEITVRNVTPRGACFTVFLPVAPTDMASEHAEAPALLAAAREHTPSGICVLLVDDEEAVLEVEREILRERGHTVYLAQTVPEAIALLERAAVNVVVADFKLPGALGGQQLYSWIRRFRPVLADHVVFTFADGQSESVSQFLAESGCAALHKPFRVDEFLSVVHLAIPGRGEEAIRE